jgi:cytochrome b
MIDFRGIPDSRRAYHTLLAASFGIAYVSDFRHLQVHVIAGYGAGLLILLRLLAEAVTARRGMFADYIFSAKEVLAHWKELAAGRMHRMGAHNPSSGSMALLLTAFVSATFLSGIAVYGAKELEGPAAGLLLSSAWWLGSSLETLHGILARVTLAFVALHITGAVYESVRGRRNWIRTVFVDNKEK